MSQDGSDKGCCCSCTQCPPWWVTMGFVPPRQLPMNMPAATAAPPATTQTGTTTGSSGGGNPLGGLGSIIGDVTGLLGGI